MRKNTRRTLHYRRYRYIWNVHIIPHIHILIFLFATLGLFSAKDYTHGYITLFLAGILILQKLTKKSVN